MRTSKARAGLRAGQACHRRWNAYGKCRTLCRHTPEVGAVCGKAARTVLCGGREATRVPTAKTACVHRRPRQRGGVATDDAGPSPYFELLRLGLRELGWIEGRNLTIAPFWATGREDVQPVASELLASDPEVIVTQEFTVLAMQALKTAKPVVFGFSGDPLDVKLVQSWAKPGGNFTGMSYLAVELVGKRCLNSGCHIPAELLYSPDRWHYWSWVSAEVGDKRLCAYGRNGTTRIGLNRSYSSRCSRA